MDVIMSGQVTAILPAQTGVSQRSGQPWMSQEYVLCHEPGQYPKSVCFRIFGQEKIQQAAIQMGETITVHLNIDARQGQKGYFNSIDCWKVERAQMMQQQGMPMQGGYQQPYQPQMQQYYQQMPPQQAPAPFPQQAPMQQPMQQQPVQQQPMQQQPMQQQPAQTFTPQQTVPSPAQPQAQQSAPQPQQQTIFGNAAQTGGANPEPLPF